MVIINAYKKTYFSSDRNFLQDFYKEAGILQLKSSLYL